MPHPLHRTSHRPRGLQTGVASRLHTEQPAVGGRRKCRVFKERELSVHTTAARCGDDSTRAMLSPIVRAKTPSFFPPTRFISCVTFSGFATQEVRIASAVFKTPSAATTFLPPTVHGTFQRVSPQSFDHDGGQLETFLMSVFVFFDPVGVITAHHDDRADRMA